ncbi:MAG: bifunctional phosphoribosyl-AMP cyclohydrolase/phosphoribosyl-ATP diphosphatase HisIE [Burkholderiales bacterium]|nr:bifunctional phosphoribosyl-AMP cyclohydrolase/phosphoribosyl-ATP diphosphatase HisIE [Burkholderiales bacterium]
MIKDINRIDFSKSSDGLIPVVIQDNATLQVLMLGYMNQESLKETISTKKVTFFSRSKQRLWVKGETSENYLLLNDIFIDCDNDTILVMATPCGPTCHTGSISCFSEQELPALGYIGMIDKIIQDRIENPTENSYTYQLISRGLNKVAQKVGEEAVEVVIAALAESREEYLGEYTDLLYHSLVLLHAQGLNLTDVAEVIAERHRLKTVSP